MELESTVKRQEFSAAVPMIDIEELLACEEATVVDLRSPSEFAVDHLPGALNRPLLSDEERAIVGLLYKQDSPERAFDQGLDFVQRTIRQWVAELVQLADLQVDLEQVEDCVTDLARGGLGHLQGALTQEAWDGTGRPLVLHCWRGGLRSQSVVALLGRLLAKDVVGLSGGYKSYRAWVRAGLEDCELPPAIVLRGLTGVGKTLVLRELEALRPGWTLDLEGIAGHRSSLLGMVGLKPVSQKAFEGGLLSRIRQGFGEVVVMEGESRRVGSVIIPKTIWEPLRGGVPILLSADEERRIDVLMADYLSVESNRVQLRVQLAQVEARMNNSHPLVELLDSKRERELVALLLEHYYDPLYQHSERGFEYALEVDATDAKSAAQQLADWIQAGAS